MEQENKNDIFLELYRNSYKKLYYFVYYILRNQEDAEDIIQETFYKAYKNYSTLRERKRVYGWLKRIAQNTALNHIRKKKNVIHNKYTDEYVEDKLNIIENISLADKIDLMASTKRLEKEIAKLKNPYKKVILLRNYRGYEYYDIAKEMNANINTVHTWYYKALLQIREGYRLALDDEINEILRRNNLLPEEDEADGNKEEEKDTSMEADKDEK